MLGSQSRHQLGIVILFVVSLIVSTIGAYSFLLNSTILRSFGLDWDASLVQGESVPLWVRICWPLAIFFSPFISQKGLSVFLYGFVGLSLQGSEAATKCLNRDGPLDWLLILILMAFVFKQLGLIVLSNDPTSEHTDSFLISSRVIILHPCFLILLAFLVWAYLCLWVRSGQTDLGVPIHYRRPFLWFHCVIILLISSVELDSDQKRLHFISFMAFVLAWRVLLTQDSVFIEGHVASYLIFLLPWLIFSAFSLPKVQSKVLQWLMFAMGLLWVLGPSLDGNLGYLATKMSNAIVVPWGRLSVFGTAAVCIGLTFWTSKTKRFYILLMLASMSVGGCVLLIANRASALALITCLLICSILIPGTYLVRVGLIALSALGILLATRYDTLMDRFRGIVTTGSGTERFDVWSIAWDQALEHPLFGLGPGQFAPNVQQFSTKIQEPLDVHSTWLEVLCETGFPGVIAFSLFWLILIISVLRSLVFCKYEYDRPMKTERGVREILQLTWCQRAFLAFFVCYVVVGFFGSRHNLPFAFVLCGCALSTIVVGGSGNTSVSLELQQSNGMSNRSRGDFLALISGGSLLLLVYASIVPLVFEPISFEQAWLRFKAIPWLQLNIYRRSDWIANGLVVVPVSFFLCGAFVRQSKNWLQYFSWLLFAILLMIGVVIGIEFLQVWFPRRTLSQNDIFAGCLGAVAGGLAWVACGRYLTSIAELACLSPNKSQRISHIAMVLSFVTVFHMLLPFDFVISLPELFKKYQHDGSSTLVIRKVLGYPIDWIDTLRNLIRYVPIGVWMAHSYPRRNAWLAVFLIPALLELCQLFIFSRNASLADAVVGGIGIQIGRTIDFDALAVRLNSLKKSTVLGSILLYYFALIVATSIPARDLVVDLRTLYQRIGSMFPVPLSRYYLKSEFSAFNLLFIKTSVFLPLGFLLALFFVKHTRVLRCRFYVLSSCLLLGLIIESSQVFLSPLIPDVWDIFVYALGGLLGYHLLQTVLMEPQVAKDDLSTKVC